MAYYVQMTSLCSDLVSVPTRAEPARVSETARQLWILRTQMDLILVLIGRLKIFLAYCTR